MTEVGAEVTNELNKSIVNQKGPEQKKSFSQEIKEMATKAWSRFNEGIKKLWGHADEKLESVNKKAGEISENTKTESLKDYFKRQIENFKDGIQARVYDLYGVFYDIGAAVSQAKVAFWNNFLGGKFVTYMAENQRNVKIRKEKARENYAKAKAKAKENREKRDKARKGAGEIRERAANAG